MLGAGLTLVVTVGLFAFGGHLVDGWVGTSPLFLLVGLILGATGGFIHLFSVVAPGMLPWSRRAGPGRTGGPTGTDSSRRVRKDPEPPTTPPQP